MTEADIINEIIERAQSTQGQRYANEILERLRNGRHLRPGKQILDLKSEDILKILNVSYLADCLFGRSRSWLCRRLNHDIVQSKREVFTTEERDTLKKALDTIAYEIQKLSNSL
ncbi:MAG: DUF5053 domain-containing protein [Muribaculaceae bacterium]|nr:DUF5053 domain-containing protein [Muribaculaceae bacterium]